MTTKKVLLFAGLGIAAYFVYTNYIKKEDAPVKKEESKSEFLGFSFGRKKKSGSIQGKHYNPLSGNTCRGNDTLINLGTTGNPYYKCLTAKPTTNKA